MTCTKSNLVKAIVLNLVKVRSTTNKAKRKKLLRSVLAASILKKLIRRKSPSLWTKQYLQKRYRLSCYNTIQKELRIQDPQCFKTYLRMTPTAFEEILNILGPTIKKEDTKFRESIPPAERLALALRFLVTG